MVYCKKCKLEVELRPGDIVKCKFGSECRLPEAVRVQAAGKKIRTFDTGATRDVDDNKLDYEGFFSPAVLKRRAEYMHKHRIHSDGSYRTSDNWQKGIPLDAYMKSAFRHFMEWWSLHRCAEADTSQIQNELVESICALMFNCEGYLKELLEGVGNEGAVSDRD